MARIKPLGHVKRNELVKKFYTTYDANASTLKQQALLEQMKQTLSMADMSLLLDLDRYVTADKGRLYAFYCSIEMNMLREQVKKTKAHLESINSRYARTKDADLKKAREDYEASLGLLALRLATEAQACKLLSERIIEEIRKDVDDDKGQVKAVPAKKPVEKAKKEDKKPEKKKQAPKTKKK